MRRLGIRAQEDTKMNMSWKITWTGHKRLLEFVLCLRKGSERSELFTYSVLLVIVGLKQRDRLQRNAQAHLWAEMLSILLRYSDILQLSLIKERVLCSKVTKIIRIMRPCCRFWQGNWEELQRNVQALVHFAKDCTSSIHTMESLSP